MSASSYLLRPTLELRNLLRNKRRSLATLLALVFGMLALLLFGGYVQSIKLGLETNIVRTAGHLQIQHADYLLFGRGSPQNYALDDYQRILETLKNDEFLARRIAVVSPTLTFNGIAGNYAKSLSKTVRVFGTVAEDQMRLRAWNEYGLPIRIREPKLLGTPADTAVIGVGVARILQLCERLALHDCPRPTQRPTVIGGSAADETPDDLKALVADIAPLQQARTDAYIELLSAASGALPNVAELRVREAERQGVRSLDDVFVGMHLAAAQRLVFGRASPPKITSIVVQLINSDDLEPVRTYIKMLLTKTFPSRPLAINDFRLLYPNFTQTVTMFDTIFSFISVLIGIIVMFMVGNTMSMAVVERTVEIGTLRALGVRRAGIQRSFVIESSVLSLFGTLGGLVLALLFSQVLEVLDLTWTPPGYVDPVPLSIRVWGEWKLMGGTLAGLLAITVISAWLPARRAANFEIVDALRHV